MAQSRSVWLSRLVSAAALLACGGCVALSRAEPEAPPEEPSPSEESVSSEGLAPREEPSPSEEPAPEVSTVQGFFNLEVQATSGAEPSAMPAVVMLEPLSHGTLPPTPRQVVRVTSATDLFTPQFVVADTGDTLVLVNGGNLRHEFFSPEVGMSVSYPLSAKSEFWSLIFPIAGVRTFFCGLHHDETFSVYVSDTPFRAVPNKNGNYVITDVPEGDYRLTLWTKATEATIRRVRVGGRGRIVENIWFALRGSGP